MTPDLPPGVTRWGCLCGLLGAATAADLSLRQGGRTVTIPTRVTANWLVEFVGERTAREIVFALAGARIYVPRSSKTARNSRIRVQRHDGLSVARIARSNGLSARHVNRILSA